MSLLVNRRVRVVPDEVTLIGRILKGEGQILVQVGQEVTPSDVIGKSAVSAGFRTLNLAHELSVSPSDVKKYLQRPVGKLIYKGELLAYNNGGIFGRKKVVTAPTDGILELIDERTGILKIKILPHENNLPAAVFGVVEKVDHIGKEVFIKTQSTQIYGLVGSGKVREGYLTLMGNRGDLIGKNKISSDFHDRILVGGGLIYGEALSQAVTIGVSGIITGGINAGDFKSMSGGRLKKSKIEVDVGIGVLVTEGFGLVPIGEDIYDLLLKYNDKFVILDGNSAVISLPALDPNCIEKVKRVQLPGFENLVKGEAAVSSEELTLSQRVRIISASFLGEQGEVVSIDKQPTKLPSGITTYMVTISTKSRKIKVPYNNIEVI